MKIGQLLTKRNILLGVLFLVVLAIGYAWLQSFLFWLSYKDSFSYTDTKPYPTGAARKFALKTGDILLAYTELPYMENHVIFGISEQCCRNAGKMFIYRPVNLEEERKLTQHYAHPKSVKKDNEPYGILITKVYGHNKYFGAPDMNYRPFRTGIESYNFDKGIYKPSEDKLIELIQLSDDRLVGIIRPQDYMKNFLEVFTYDYRTGKLETIGKLKSRRENASFVKMPDDRIVAMGGYDHPNAWNLKLDRKSQLKTVQLSGTEIIDPNKKIIYAGKPLEEWVLKSDGYGSDLGDISAIDNNTINFLTPDDAFQFSLKSNVPTKLLMRHYPNGFQTLNKYDLLIHAGNGKKYPYQSPSSRYQDCRYNALINLKSRETHSISGINPTRELSSALPINARYWLLYDSGECRFRGKEKPDVYLVDAKTYTAKKILDVPDSRSIGTPVLFDKTKLYFPLWVGKDRNKNQDMVLDLSRWMED
ncbi:MAG: hypothetical protein QE263_02010 [Vampirovibrionales bacterium]|nr:hypothetical protein [Vampirovibrionales bacterium]